ncbi:FAD-dependent monooxygenase [Streptomyces sp. LHD-70]|uniref:FAD-dependent monooxygenase n=1 Tax=Streptomyces sp. LHD-70 TaxID=3072140 RepID=UPI00280E2BD9|nr:FAD-dependent monooxygenase [Streptomyces sp. LHD-70]MDQ8705199.1 FAD-dependent monooxygenase [Streptomyces sp. LHD-70]
MQRRAIVIGGGVGGLTTAVALRAAGWNVEVHERASGPPDTGSSLGLWPGALRALDGLGLADSTRRAARPAAYGTFVRADGTRIGDVDMAALQRRSGDRVHVVARPVLLRALTDALDEGIVRYGSRITDVQHLDHDVVIAADGLRSRARTALFGDAHGPRYSGVTAWHGTVGFDTDGMTETWGRRARFGVIPRAGGLTHWFACAPAAELEPSPGGELAALQGWFGDWHPGVRRVLDHLAEAGEAAIGRNDLYDLSTPLPHYTSGRIALIGDAAHAMTPDLGRGACEAIVDGVTLARALTTHADVQDALTVYDTIRRRPTQRLARAARLMNRVVHTPRRVTRVRDAAMKLFLAVGRPPA